MAGRWNGKLLKTVTTPSRNTSGMAVGGGYVWMIANAPPEGVFQVDMNSKLISHRQIPLGRRAAMVAGHMAACGMKANSGSRLCGCAVTARRSEDLAARIHHSLLPVVP